MNGTFTTNYSHNAAPSPSDFRLSSVARKTFRGFTLAELIAVMAVTGICIGLFLPMFAPRRCGARSLKDSTQIRGIHQAWLTFAGDGDGSLPTPGLVQRQPIDGLVTPGRGNEDRLRNNTANLHALCIAMNFYTPDFCIGQTEPSSNVIMKDDFNWDSYSPLTNTYWDTTFKADLQTKSHISYANMPIVGERQLRHWINTLNSAVAIIGNRGVRNGSSDPIIHDSSITLLIHGKPDVWQGYVCYADNHNELFTGFYAPALMYQNRSGAWQSDNIFRNDQGSAVSASAPGGIDNWLVITQYLFGTPDQVLGMRNSWD